ncbi:MAG: AarF/ABC1/UbiB kinase family protein [Myxococcota bacterium]|nr:AarF/ABC1/UbiB kinase family protein [Myxococcales bacterium]
MPSGRAERLASLGVLAGKLALGGAAEGVRRLAGASADAGHVLLSGANARRLVASLSSMRGAAMKLGQLLSLEAEDLLAPEVADALAALRDAGHAMPQAQLERVLRDAYGARWRDRFAEFDPEPIAAASIGQVHAARATDGRDLALKIQYPGVARSIDSDVDNLAAALRLARILPGNVDFAPLLEEAKRQLRDEADYAKEASFLARYRALLADESRVVVPAVHDDLTTGTILAMDRLYGMPLEELCSPEYDDAARNDAAELLLRIVLREFFEFHFVQSDPNFANYLLLPDRRIGLLDLGAGYDADPALCRAYAKLFRASAAADREAVRAVATEIGFVAPDDAARDAEAVLDLVWLATEPFRRSGPYDFGASDLPSRARAKSAEIVFEHGFWRPPPPATLFLQRKLGGTFLLCVKLRAKVDARALVERVLDEFEIATTA